MAIRGASVSITIEGSQSGAIGIATPLYNPKFNFYAAFTSGNDSADKLDLIGSGIVTLTGGNDDLDIAGGGLVDADNNPVTPAEGDVLVIFDDGTNQATFTFDTTLVNGWQGFFNGVGTVFLGGFAAFGCKHGPGVTAGTADLIRFVGTAGDKARVLLLGRTVALP